MSKKHGKVLVRLRKQLDKMRVAFALAEDHVEELLTLHDEDVAAIEHPKPKKGKLPKPVKWKKPKPNYTRG